MISCLRGYLAVLKHLPPTECRGSVVGPAELRAARYPHIQQFTAIGEKNRLKEYDYSLEGYYYVTVCTYDRHEIFGVIENGEMKINQYGRIVENTWLQIPNHFRNVELDEFIVMPNHIHGIIIIDNPVGTGHALSFNKGIKNNNLSVIIGSFKSDVSKQINQLNHMPFKWQRSFYDHIIRTNHSLENIREYISNNIETWDTDENNIINYFVKGKASFEILRTSCLAPTVNINSNNNGKEHLR